MNKSKQASKTIDSRNLLERVVLILESARANIVRSVNSSMVTAYWLIGREIVEDIQAGEERAEYGKQIVERLSVELNKKYGRGFSRTNLSYFRQFYLTYEDRLTILHPPGGKLAISSKSSLVGS